MSRKIITTHEKIIIHKNIKSILLCIVIELSENMFEEMSDDKCLPNSSVEMKIKERMVYLFYELHRKTHPRCAETSSPSGGFTGTGGAVKPRSSVDVFNTGFPLRSLEILGVESRFCSAFGLAKPSDELRSSKSMDDELVEKLRFSDKGSPDNYYRLSMELGELLIFIKKNIREGFTGTGGAVNEYLLYLFKMIVQTRDIYEGKGERDVTYMLIYTWYKHYPVLAVNVLPFIIQYGCWRDICGICNYVFELSGDDSHPLIETCVEIMIQQLEKDENCTGTGISLAAKWVPREKRQNQWLYDLFVLKWSNKKWPYILHTSKYSCVANGLAWNKCRMKFRKMISNLTKKIDIIETKQCSGKWATIHPCHVNIGTIIKQKECLLNIKNNKKRTLENCDILQCSQNMQKLYKNGFPKSHRNNINNNKSLLSIPINYFVKRAIELLASQENHDKNKIKNIYGPDSNGSHSEGFTGTSGAVKPRSSVDVFNTGFPSFAKEILGVESRFCALACGSTKPSDELRSSKSMDDDSEYIKKEIDLLNIQWKKYISTCVNLPNIIPIINLSSNYSDKELYNAIGLACLITEKSLISKRIMVTQNENVWINLENCIDFISMVQAIYNNCQSFDNLVLSNSMNKIIESIQHSNMTNENIQEMIFVIFQSDTSNHSNICKMFNSYQPHFVYWNLSESVSEVIEYPCDIYARGTTMLSGNSPALINYLQFLGLASFRHSTPYNAVCNILDNNRYDSIEKLFMNTIE